MFQEMVNDGMIDFSARANGGMEEKYVDKEAQSVGWMSEVWVEDMKGQGGGGGWTYKKGRTCLVDWTFVSPDGGTWSCACASGSRSSEND